MTNPDQSLPDKIGGEKYTNLQYALGKPPIEMIIELRNRHITRGDGSQGPMTFQEIATEVSRHARRAVSKEAIRRWYREAVPDAPQRAPRTQPDDHG